ncbi:MAG TPA: hypothetical protein VHS81_13330 [Caulobacteraceae bacterium]|jgi:hypothetical protein|nr:hypothetical protein [Caulobacteraceae bacterium]
MTPADTSLKHSREDAPWTWCGERGGPDFGCVFAWQAARGAVELTFDRQGLHHALTLFAPVRPGAEIAIFGRRFDVVWADRATERA